MLHRLSFVVLVVGLVVTGALTASSRLSYLHNEQRLSNLQTSLTASALGVAPVDLERRLGQAAGGGRRSVRSRRHLPSGHRALDGAGGAVCDRIARSRAQRARPGRWRMLGAQPINSPTGKAASALFERAAKSALARHDQSRGQGTAAVRLSDVVRRTGWNLRRLGADKPCRPSQDRHSAELA